MLFTKRRFPPPHIILVMVNNTSLDGKNEITYLGLDRSLTFSKHVEHVNKIQATLFKLYPIFKGKYYVNGGNKSIIYKRIIRPRMLYGPV